MVSVTRACFGWGGGGLCVVDPDRASHLLMGARPFHFLRANYIPSHVIVVRWDTPESTVRICSDQTQKMVPMHVFLRQKSMGTFAACHLTALTLCQLLQNYSPVSITFLPGTILAWSYPRVNPLVHILCYLSPSNPPFPSANNIDHSHIPRCIIYWHWQPYTSSSSFPNQSGRWWVLPSESHL